MRNRKEDSSVKSPGAPRLENIFQVRDIVAISVVRNIRKPYAFLVVTLALLFESETYPPRQARCNPGSAGTYP